MNDREGRLGRPRADMLDLIHTYLLTFQYHRDQYLPLAVLRARQKKKLDRLVAYARARSPFFRELYNNVPEHGFALSDLPVVDKSMMMERFDEYVTDRRLKLRKLRQFVADPLNIGKKYLGYIAFHTSGTGGEPAVIVYDRWGFNRIRALNLARGLDQKPLFISVFMNVRSRLRIAAVLMDGGLFPGYSNFIHPPRFSSLISRVKTFSIRDPVEKVAAALQAYRPRILMGYPSVITLLAREQLAGRLSILNRRRHHRVACLGEPLTEEARRLIRRAFPCPLIDIYGSGECLTIAQSCGTGDGPAGLHVNEDAAILEIVDSNGRPVPPGTEGGKIYLTNLVNHVQPFIRYEIGDVVSYRAEPCACGRSLPLIGGVSGRTDDIIYVGRPGGGAQAVPPYWLMVPLIGFPEIAQWQVTQTGRNTLAVSLVPAPGRRLDPADVERALRRSLAQSRVAVSVELIIKEVSSIAPDPVTGKTRRIWSAVGPP